MTAKAKKKARKKKARDYFQDVFESYFRGWRDGYVQAINDVQPVLDDQTNKESNQ
jgi:hypothetical protein